MYLSFIYISICLPLFCYLYISYMRSFERQKKICSKFMKNAKVLHVPMLKGSIRVVPNPAWHIYIYGQPWYEHWMVIQKTLRKYEGKKDIF